MNRKTGYRIKDLSLIYFIKVVKKAINYLFFSQIYLSSQKSDQKFRYVLCYIVILNLIQNPEGATDILWIPAYAGMTLQI